MAMTDHELASLLATEAGALLVRVRAGGVFDGAALGDAGDMLANAFICRALAAHRPDDAILSEENVDSAARLASDRVWIVDPLDGTREYREGRDDWAVHIALAERGRPVSGAVALPMRGQVFRTDAALPSAPPARDRPIMVVSRTRAPAIAGTVAAAIGAAMVPMGSAGAKAMAVVDGTADCYLHVGPQGEWDNCAPLAVAAAAGLWCARLDGSPIRYNQPTPIVPDLIIARAEWRDRIVAALR